jgi:DnaJ-class molecular chaperone
MNKILRRAKDLAMKRLSGQPDANEACLACNGSGHYDHNGSPVCTSCHGSGKRRNTR